MLKLVWEWIQITLGFCGLLLAVVGALWLIHDCSKNGGVMAFTAEPAITCIKKKP